MAGKNNDTSISLNGFYTIDYDSDYITKLIRYDTNNWFSKLYSIDFHTLSRSSDPCNQYNNSPNLTISAYTLCKINNKKVGIWLTMKGEICYRLSPF